MRQLTPPPLIVQFHHVDPLEEGSIADFTMWMGPIPVRWTAIHSQVTSHGFTDKQTRGPFRAWEHRHHFQELDDGRTEVVDEIKAELGGLISRFMWLTLPLLFAYRGWRTRRICQRTGAQQNS